MHMLHNFHAMPQKGIMLRAHMSKILSELIKQCHERKGYHGVAQREGIRAFEAIAGEY